jgi:MFS family permease
MTAAPFGLLNFALLVAAGSAALLFGIRQLKAPSPLVRLTMLRDPVLTAGLAMSTLVMTVMMTTLVVGPFYLSQALGLDGAVTGLAMAVGPIVAALAGVPGGRIADRLGGARVLIAGLLGMGVGCSFLATTPVGVIGYVASLAIITAGYALFQAANNSMVMIGAEPRERGAVSGLLSLSRNLGLITGASAMGAVFALGSGTTRLAAAPAVSIANGMHLSYAIAAGLVVAALSCAFISRGSA